MSTPADTPPEKPVRDPQTYAANLCTWMLRSYPGRSNLRVQDVDMPTATGFSNETVFFSATWQTPFCR